MATAVANLAVLLTAKTGRFAADMNRARRPMIEMQRTARTVRRGIQVAFGALALRGLTSALTGAVSKARELGVYLNRADRTNLNDLYKSVQALQFVVTRLTLRLVAAAGPALKMFINLITAASLWLESNLNPQTLKLAGATLKVVAALALATVAFKTVIVVQRAWNNATKISVVLQATLAALTGNWVALAAAATVFGGSLYGINKAFAEFGEDGERSVGGVSDKVKELTDRMRGLGEVGVGKMGLDFMPLSQVEGTPQYQELMRHMNQQGMANDIRDMAADARDRRRKDLDDDYRWRHTTFGGRFHASRGIR